MTSFTSIAATNHRFLRIFAVLLLPILSAMFIASPGYAEEDIDSRESEAATFSQAQLDQILAPIALYPDTVLSQVLIAATYPIEVVQADRWARAHPNVKGDDAVQLVEDKDWDPSVKALVAFPDILQRMSDDIDWTQQLGDAFLVDEGRVMDTVQNLRQKAYASGSLNKVQHLKVQRDNDEIIIEPAEERVVYVPVYDTRVVYGNWWWPEYPPVYWHYPSHYTYVSGFYWGPRIFIGPTFFYSSFHWRQRHVVVVDHHHHRNHYRNSRPHYYTGRSIVHHQGARQWRHEPTHRRGVAYYNNRVRENYGSRRESYRDAHVYRDQHRERNSDVRGAARHRFDENQRGNPRAGESNRVNAATPDRASQVRPPIDRAEQLRGRMQRPDKVNNNSRDPATQVNQNNARQNIDRGRHLQGNDRQPADNKNADRNLDRIGDRDRNRAAPNQQTTPRAVEPDRGNNQERGNRNHREAIRTPTEQPRPQPNVETPRVERAERVERVEREQNNERRAEVNNRPSRVDDGMTRRTETTRDAPRERHHNEGGNRARGGDSRGEDRGRH
ncbi:MAG: DUF3300 domain-containing protein [Pseudomonadota bacterium]